MIAIHYFVLVHLGIEAGYAMVFYTRLEVWSRGLTTISLVKRMSAIPFKRVENAAIPAPKRTNSLR